MGMQTISALSVLSLTPPLGILFLVQWRAVSIHLCICQALAEPLRRQLYQAFVSMHFLASLTVSDLGDCVWDGFSGGVVSGWPLLFYFSTSLSLFLYHTTLFTPPRMPWINLKK